MGYTDDVAKITKDNNYRRVNHNGVTLLFLLYKRILKDKYFNKYRIILRN